MDTLALIIRLFLVILSLDTIVKMRLKRLGLALVRISFICLTMLKIDTLRLTW